MASSREEQALIHLSTARQEIAKAHSVDEVVAIRDKAEALRAYAKVQGMSLEIQNKAAEIKIRAERRAGEILRDMEKHPAGRPAKNRLHAATDLPPRLSDLGVTKSASSRWQQIAAIPETLLEQHLARVRKAKGEITTADVLRLAGNKSPEWYTNAGIIEAARAVLGDIGLDPASNSGWNETTVKAGHCFSLEERGEDGLDPRNKWLDKHGKPCTVWLNPPYLGLAGPFVARLLHEHYVGNVTAAITLLNVDSVTADWFRPMWNHPLCFVHGRPPFGRPDGSQSGTRIGFVLAYLGPDVRRFIEEFWIYGPAARRRMGSNLPGRTPKDAWSGGYIAMQTDLFLHEQIQSLPDPMYEAFQNAKPAEAVFDEDLTEEQIAAEEARESERLAMEQEAEAEALRPWREYLQKPRRKAKR